MANGKEIVVPAGEGLVWQMAPDRSATLKLQNDETGASVMMFEEIAPVGMATDLNLHRDSDEVAYVLGGEITFKIGEQVTVMGPGACAFIPRGVPHAWKSTGAEPSRVLFLYTPGRAGRIFEEIARHPGGPLRKHELADIRERAGSERVGPSPF